MRIKSTIGWGVFIAVPVIGLALMSVHDQPAGNSAGDAANVQARATMLARAACKQYIHERLHDQKNVEFIEWDRAPAMWEEKNVRVEMEVRGRNAFNADRRVTFDCTVGPQKGNADPWALIALHQRR